MNEATMEVPPVEHSLQTTHQGPLSISELVANKDVVLAAIGQAMQKDQDYGVIPGTKKNTLYKPGAEKLLMMFKLCAAPEHTEDLSTSDEARYRITTKIIHVPSGLVVGYGLGEASSDEEKYRWRKASAEEWEETPVDRRRKKWVQKWVKGQKVYQDGKPIMEGLLQVRTNKADLANTILKMADKRSFVGATLKVTAASSVFTQDLEDFNEEMREVITEAEEAEKANPQTDPILTPQRASETAAAPAPAQPAKPKADASWRKMESKKDGGTCATCHKRIALSAPIYYDGGTFAAHHQEHFA